MSNEIQKLAVSKDEFMLGMKSGEVQEVTFSIPICCREGWKSCPHVIKKQRPKKRNIAL